ncbi:MAG: hypothetical protein GEU80_04540 [Dehalococcoidia bacterium]|nr:hypothetical protein [Dehalococcoidia bacterium]
MTNPDDRYWRRLDRHRLSRRGLLRAAGVTGVGLGAAALIGCGSDDDGDDGDSGTPGGGGGTATQSPSSPDASGAVQGGVLRMYGQDPIGFDPHANFSYRTHQNQSFFQEGLLEVPIGPDAQPTDFTAVPNVGEQWEQVDEVTFTVPIQPGVKFHNKPPVNGRELVAEDVRYSYERMVERLFTYRDLVEGVIESMDVVDDHTITFHLTAPYADFTGNLANHYNWIVAHEIDDTFGDAASPEAAVGLGPFMLESYEPNVKTSYVANPDYFRGRPNIDTVEFLVLPDAATRESMMRSGDLDTTSIATLTRASIEGTNPDLQWAEYYSNGGDIFYWNSGPGDFAEDVRVRQAFALAVDRQAWLDSFYLGAGTIHNGPPVLAAYGDWQVPLEDLGEGARFWEYDPDESRKLLTAAGFDFERTYKMDGTAAYGAATVDRMQLAIDMLGEVGVKLETNLKEYGDWLATGHAGIYEDFAFGPMTPQLSIDAWVWGLFHSSSGVNKSHLVDPRIDELVDATRTLYDVEERKAAVAEASKYIAEVVPYVYPPAGIGNYAAQPWLKNYGAKAGYYPGKTVREAWVERDA